MSMANKQRKYYLFASDFDQTLTFNDSGYVLSELLGISTEEFERRIKGMAKLNLATAPNTPLRANSKKTNKF